MEERKDICEGYERDSVQQLDKLAKDKNERFPIYPLTYIQAVYDARTKERLDSILWKCNNVYLPWMGSAGDTRVQLPFWMRRKGIIITYKNLDDETITEKLTYDLCIADDFFRLDSSWTRITDALPVGGNITIGSNGNWFQDGVDTGFKAQGPKGDNGLTPMLRTVNNKLRYSYDGEVWNEISEYIAAWFRYQDNKIQISRDQKTWSDLSKPFTQDLYIKGYVATSSALPSTGVKQGDIYMVGPTYAAEDTEHKNPIYRMYVYNDSGWVDNGVFQSIAAGVVQTIGNSETEVMSQKAVSSIVGLDTYPVFSDTKPYVKGEIVNYGGLLYEFTADHEEGAWIGTDARETSLREEVTKELTIKSQGFTCSNPITNEIIKEIFYAKKDFPVYFSLALNYLATDNKYHNRLYVINKYTDKVEDSIFDFSYDAFDECKVGLTDDIYLNGSNPIRSAVAINNNYRRTNERIEDNIFTSYYSLDACPNIKNYIESSLKLTDDSITNLYIKELVVPDINIGDIKNIRLNLCIFVNSKYYNACYIDLNPTGVYTVFENAYDTFDECANNCNGVIYNEKNKAGALIEYSGIKNFTLTRSPLWNHDLTIDFAPTIKNYLNKFTIEKINDYFDVTDNLIFKTSDMILKDQFFSGSSYIESKGYSVSQPILCKAGITYKYNFDKAGMGNNINCCKVDKYGLNPVAFTVNLSPDDSTATFSFTEDTYVRINCGRNLDSIILTEESIFPDPFSYSQGGNILNESFILNESQKKQVENISENAINNLANKIIAWDGDSIAAGDKGTPWASIIMSKNKMIGKNFSVGGATITSGTTTSSGINRHWVSYNIDTIHQQYPALDYLILEGGSNDADLESQIQIGIFDPLDFDGPFDNTTFHGALDYLFSKAITYYPGTKIGFIIAVKMGKGKYSSVSNRRDFFDKIKLVCEKWGIPYIDLWKTSPMNPNMSVYWNPDLTPEENIAQGYYYADGQHPTTVGYNYTAPMIESWIKTL